MKGLFAPPGLLAAYAYGVYEGDPDLVWGTHLRVFAGLGASFPLAPLAVWRFQSQVAEPPPFSVDVHDDYVDVTVLPFAAGRFHYVRLTLLDPDGRYWRVELRDSSNRLMAAREQPPWQFAAPVLHKLRLWGDVDVNAIWLTGIAVDTEAFLEETPFEPQEATLLGLPVNGRFRWYSGYHDIAGGIDRGVRAAPLRLTPPDRPDGPFALADPFDAVERVRLEAVVGAQGGPGGGLETLLARLVRDEPPPWEQRDAQAFVGADGKPHYVKAGRLAQLQMAAFDPGVARVCGFADLIEDQAALDHREFWDTLAVVGLLALEPRAFLPRNIDLTGLVNAPDPHAGRLLELLVAALAANAPDRDWATELDESSARARKQELLVAPFIAPVAPVRPWLPPTLAQPALRDHRWQPARDEQPSDRYRATFVFPGAPATTQCAQALRRDGTWQTRHALLDVAQLAPPQRAQPSILGQTGYGDAAAGLLSDYDLPAEAGDVTYRVHAADYFGRFSPPTDFTLAPPPRPLPPPPVLRYQIIPTAIADPLSPDPLSPGTLRLTVARGLPGDEPFSEREQQLLGTAIVVPRLQDLAAGSYPPATLTLAFDGAALPPIDVSAPGFITVDQPLPALLPQAQGVWQLTGIFTDTAGNETPPAVRPVVEIRATDRRPPPVYPSGVGLLWTSAPGPAPEVELTLTWQAAPNSRHNVYLTDRAGLGLTDDVIRALLTQEGLGAAWPQGDALPSRGLVAAAGCKRVRRAPGAVPKEVFRLLTDPPIAADAAGRVVLRTTLPRSLGPVQFLRVVPLGPDGAEPPFEECGIIPVAVPDSRRPPAPQLSGAIDPVGGVATLTVAADGFNMAALVADEPGLVTPGQDGVAPPRYRLRRAVGAVGAPLYARPLGEEGVLTLVDADVVPAVFSADVADDNGGGGLAPFVPYVYWAEVRLPDERPLPAGWLAEAGGVTAFYPAHALPHPRPFSLPSAPLTLMHVPAEPPPALPADGVTIVRRQPDGLGRVALTLTLVDPPRSHRKAVDKYRLAVWGQWGEEPLQRLGMVDGAWPVAEGGSVSVVMPPPTQGAPAGPLGLRLALVDPVGRYGLITPFVVEEPALPPPLLSAVTIRAVQVLNRVLLFADWKIVQPAPPASASDYTLTVSVQQAGGLPQTSSGTLDQVPELSPLAVLSLPVNRLARLAGEQQYVMRLSSIRPVRVVVTVTDALGQSVTGEGTLA